MYTYYINIYIEIIYFENSCKINVKNKSQKKLLFHLLLKYLPFCL